MKLGVDQIGGKQGSWHRQSTLKPRSTRENAPIGARARFSAGNGVGEWHASHVINVWGDATSRGASDRVWIAVTLNLMENLGLSRISRRFWGTIGDYDLVRWARYRPSRSTANRGLRISGGALVGKRQLLVAVRPSSRSMVENLEPPSPSRFSS